MLGLMELKCSLTVESLQKLQRLVYSRQGNASTKLIFSSLKLKKGILPIISLHFF